MKTILIAVLATMTLGASGTAQADVRLAESKQCLQCHAVDRHAIGPSFQTIKAVYRDMRDPQTRLIEVMRDGSEAHLGPHWGKARMPNDRERPKISDDEAKQLARWILAR